MRALASKFFSEKFVRWIGVFIVAATLTSCSRQAQPTDTARLDPGLTSADSVEEMERAIRTSLSFKYENVTDGYRVYQVTNGNSQFVFLKAHNAPRGFGMFNLYCYESIAPSKWILRGYVPVNGYFFTNGIDWNVTFVTKDEYVMVVFRETVVFTVKSK